ncbi:MAG: anaerobic ribonucleoside-triphosphate reductase activating protein [Atopobiaceae bacterium]|nr:anaerobic ribonucleoside-triphosphate reductase activating protein [Atopobiaceae bacterium]
MNYSEIKYCDIANGAGVRTTLFVSGCRHHCPQCFNPGTWAFDSGKEYTREVEDKILESLEPAYVDGLTLLGGEPFEPENQPALISLLQRVRAEQPSKNVWAYSGFTWDQLLEGPSRAHTDTVQEMLSLVDVLVDGPFVQEKKDITLRFRGSSNQRIIDVRRSLAAREVCLWEDDPLFTTHTW